jgi:hydrogenase expression/formation protein HypD
LKYLEEFRDAERVRKVANAAAAVAPADRAFAFMEVCGTHTMAVARYGLKKLLPPNVRLISGPGCPVCVTPKEYVDHAVALAREPDIVVATFGDMMRVPGSSTDLLRQQAEGADVRVVYSARDAVAFARAEPDRRVVFLGVGFETTAPTVAATVKEAAAAGIRNYFVLAAHKLIPPAMRALCESGDVALDGFLCPAHVSAIIGADAYEFIARDHGLACAVAGFEPVDILQGIYLLLKQYADGKRRVDNQYSRVVKREGNLRAQEVQAEVFDVCDSRWRGLGDLPASGLAMRDEYAALDAARALEVEPEETVPDHGCICGDVLTGAKVPADCPLFGDECAPAGPVGPCMVSSEGSCAAAYKFEYE